MTPDYWDCNVPLDTCGAMPRSSLRADLRHSIRQEAIALKFGYHGIMRQRRLIPAVGDGRQILEVLHEAFVVEYGQQHRRAGAIQVREILQRRSHGQFSVG